MHSYTLIIWKGLRERLIDKAGETEHQLLLAEARLVENTVDDAVLRQVAWTLL